MNKKIFVIVFIVALLAFLGGYLIIDKNASVNVQSEEQVINVEIDVNKNSKNDISVEKVQDTTSDVERIIIPDRNKPKSVLNNENIKIKNITETKMTDEKKEGNSSVQIGGVIEEVEDYGVRTSEDGLVEITREFRMKSPRKYSFVDFGFLEKVVR